MKLIDKDVLVAEIERRINAYQKIFDKADNKIARLSTDGRIAGLKSLLDFIDTVEVKEVDLEKESELIANGIMISVQSNKYGTNTYNTERNDFNHYHLKMAARKGIELGLKAQKGEINNETTTHNIYRY